MLVNRFAPAWLVLMATPAIADDNTDNSGDTPEVQAPGTIAPIETRARREPTGRFVIGAGVSADDGPIMHAQVAQPDLFRTGQGLSLTMDASPIRQRAALDYHVPLLSSLDFDGQLFATRRNFGDFTREGVGGEARLAYKLDRATRIYGRYRIEAVETALNPVDAMAKQDPRFGDVDLGNGTVATLGAGIVYDTLDEPYLPRRGTRFELFADRADRKWGSAYNFDRTGGSFDLARGVGPFTLRVHGHAAYIQSRDPMGVPLSERLHHDGHAEVRGYALDSLPALGSNVEAVGRVELELPIWKKAGLSLAGWADAGLRHNTDQMSGQAVPGGPADSLVQRSLGASLIWRSPIGPLRFDIAFPMEGRDRDRQFLFGLGGWWW